MPLPTVAEPAIRSAPRDAALDVARGIGIVLVVFGHLQRGLLDLGTTAHPGLLRVADFVLYTTHMPLFFVLAGRTAAASIGTHGRSRFLRTRPRAVLWPYALWSTLFVVSQQLAAAAVPVHHPVPLAALALAPVVPVGIFWFLHALFCAQLLAALSAGRAGVLLGLALGADLAVTLAVPPEAAQGLPQLALHLPFFAFGMLWAERGQPVPRWLDDGLAAAPLLCGTIGLGLIASACGSARPVELWTLPVSALGVAALLNLSRTWTRRGSGALLAGLGRASLPIYVLHVFTLPLFMRLAQGLPPRFDAVALAAGTAFGVAASLALHRVLAWAKLDAALGLPAAPRAPAPVRDPPGKRRSRLSASCGGSAA